MQRNCHEFIAYENLVGRRAQPVERRPQAAPVNGAPKESSDIDQIIPLIKRALKVLADREVSPQLGLLKSTLLQLDSTFSERNYGSSTFRDFIEKVSKTGAVTLRQSGRNMMVDLPENGAAAEPAPPAISSPDAPVVTATTSAPMPVVALDPARLSEMTEQVRQVFLRAAQPPRWPMYIRQLKQYLRANDKSLEEQTAGQGALLDLMRACQREGILRLERDRRGQMRVFPGSALTSGSIPESIAAVADLIPAVEESNEQPPAIFVEPIAEEVNGNVLDAEEISPLAVQAPSRARRVRKPAAASPRKRAPRKTAKKLVN
jgi:hypothetical protein